MEDIVLQTELLTEFEFVAPQDYVVRAIVLLPENIRLNEGVNEVIFGRTMKNWVAKSLDNFETRFVSLGEKDNPLEVVKPFIKDEDFTIVLFADTPLIKNTTVYDVVEYAQTKKLDFCKLPRGFIVSSQNFKSGKVEFSAEPNFVDKQDFFTVFDNSTLCKAKEVLKDRILEKHLKNKVVIDDKFTTFIDADVEIAKGVKISAFNVLKGKSFIDEGAQLLEYNKIEDSVVGKGVRICFSTLKNAKVEDNKVIGPFENINNLFSANNSCDSNNFDIEDSSNVEESSLNNSEKSFVNDNVFSENHSSDGEDDE